MNLKLIPNLSALLSEGLLPNDNPANNVEIPPVAQPADLPLCPSTVNGLFLVFVHPRFIISLFKRIRN